MIQYFSNCLLNFSMSISIANGFASTYSELLESFPSVREAINRQIVQKREMILKGA